jgi:hypothetical protein
LARIVDADEAADGLAVVQRVLNPFVRQPKAVLRDVHPEHALQPDERAASVALGVVRLDHRHQLRPGVAASIWARKRSRRVSFFLAAY